MRIDQPDRTGISGSTYPLYQTRDLSLLFEMGDLFSSTGSIEELFRLVLEFLCDNLKLERAAIIVRDPSDDDLTIDVFNGYSDEQILKTRSTPVSLTAWPAGNYSGKHTVSPIGKNETVTEIRGDDSSSLFIPVLLNHDNMGTILAEKNNRNGSFLENEAAILTAASVMAAQALKNRSILADAGNENRSLRNTPAPNSKKQLIIGNSRAIHEFHELASLAAGTDFPVLVSGESGTGKSLAASIIHANSPRKKGPFLRINISALPHFLTECELFSPGIDSHNGKTPRKNGLLEKARRGTLLLDEIGDLDPGAQEGLLRLMKRLEAERNDSQRPAELDIRVIATSRRDLKDAVNSDAFNAELLRMLTVFHLNIPPLRERASDIIPLAGCFLKNYSSKYNKRIRNISPEAAEYLNSYSWPGNIRELEECMERAVIVCGGTSLKSVHLPDYLQSVIEPEAQETFEDMVNGFQKKIIVEYLRKTRGNISHSASLLGTTKRILTYTIHKLGIDYRDFR